MKIRKTCPKKNNKYYNNKIHGGLSDAVNGYPMISGLTVLDNCVGWANSRFNEIINDPNLEGIVKKFKYQLVCDAEDFIESAKRQGLKISSSPIEGGIMVWQKGSTLSPSDGAGHVAVVERVYEDGTILTSESGWASWTFKTICRDNKNGRWGQNPNYRFRGCIINPSIKNPKVVPVPPLDVDGVGGNCTVRAMQRFFGTVQDGVLSGQNRACAKYYPALEAVEYGSGGSACVKKMQKWLGITQDGVWGKDTSKALQKVLGVTADGIFGTASMKAWQKYLNEHKKATYPAPTPSVDKKDYDFIDVSDWQRKINWAKVKADGIDGAIIRYADGDTLDERFTENMSGAIKAGLHVGAYIFSRARTKAEAEKEAERLYKACKAYKYDMPLYIDIEVESLGKYADTVAAAFLNKMAALGVRGGVYSYLNYWDNHLTKTLKDYSASALWIAQYNDKMTHKDPSKFGMWQYTSSGSVDGISGRVDRDKCYVAYWNIKKKTNGEKIAEKAREFAYTTNSSKANYETGKPKEAYKKGLNEAYPDRSGWGKPPREGCSCDVSVGTSVRCSGVDKKYPRGLSKSYLAKSDKFERVKMGKIKDFKSWMKNGDIIITDTHTCIYDNGKIKEASHPKWDEKKKKYVGGFYPKTTDKVIARLSADGAEVYRAK